MTSTCWRTLRYDKAATTTIYTSMVARRIGTSDYRVKIRPGVSSTSLDLVRTISGAETVLASQVVPGFVMSPSSEINLRLQTVGSRDDDGAGEVLADRCGRAGGVEPHGDRHDGCAPGAGAVGFYSYMGSSATNAPVTLQVQNFAASTPTGMRAASSTLWP